MAYVYVQLRSMCYNSVITTGSELHALILAACFYVLLVPCETGVYRSFSDHSFPW